MAILIFFILVTMITPLQSQQKTSVIASWNVLHETFYEKYSAPKPFIRMPFTERAILFKKLMDSMTNTVDIFNLQECGSFSFSDVFKEEYELVSGIDEYLITAYKRNSYSTIKTDSVKSNGVGHGKGFLVTILKPKNNPSMLIGVINVHLPFARSPQDHQKQLADLYAIRSYINNNAAIKHWFVCGDFNISADKARTIEDTLNIFAHPGTTLKSLAYNLPTAMGHKGLEHIDYIFYTPSTIKKHTYATIPSSKNQADTLLTQGFLAQVTTDAGRGHPSDHAVITVKYSLIPT